MGKVGDGHATLVSHTVRFIVPNQEGILLPVQPSISRWEVEQARSLIQKYPRLLRLRGYQSRRHLSRLRALSLGRATDGHQELCRLILGLLELLSASEARVRVDCLPLPNERQVRGLKVRQ